MNDQITIQQNLNRFLIKAPEGTDKTKVEELNKRITKTQEKLEIVLGKYRDPNSFLPFENGPENLHTIIKHLQRTIDILKDDLEKESAEVFAKDQHLAIKRMGYPDRLDLRFLALTKTQERKHLGFTIKDVWPAFIVIDVNNEFKQFEIEVFKTEWGSVDSTIHLPTEISKYFHSTVTRLKDLFIWKTGPIRVSIQAEYKGMLPNKLRLEIQSLIKAKTFDNIFVIAEAPEWKLNITVPTVQYADPIVIGWKEDTKQAYVIGVYDPTKLEQYIAEQCGFSISIPEE